MKENSHAIIFDWNGTLLDDFDIIHRCLNEILRRLGRMPVTAEDFRTHYDIPFERLYFNLGFSETEIEHIMNVDTETFYNLYEELAPQASLREGASSVLEHARRHGSKTLILSNHVVSAINTQLQRLAIDHLFDDILAHTNQETQFRDMDKGERLRRYMRAKKFTPANAIIIGDSVEEIEIARNQDFASVAITGGGVSEKRLREAKPDYVIHSLSELLPILEERGFVS